MSDFNRDDLEREALKNVCSCWYYDLSDTLEEVTDEDLRKVIADPQYFHRQNQVQNPVSKDELREELENCTEPQDLEKILISDDGDDWTCICGNNTMSTGFYNVNDKNDFVEPTPEAWNTENYGCADCGRIINMNTGEVVDYTDAKKLQKQMEEM